MRIFCLSLSLFFFALAGFAREDDEDSPYLGDWSNGRGETLVITAKTVQFADDKPVRYRDITRASDGRTFHLQLNVGEGNNYFSKFMTIYMKGKNKIRTEGYDNWADQGGENVSVQTWDRD